MEEKVGGANARSPWPARVLIVGWAAKEWEDNPIEAVMEHPQLVEYHNLAQSLRLNVPVRQLLGFHAVRVMFLSIELSMTFNRAKFNVSMTSNFNTQ